MSYGLSCSEAHFYELNGLDEMVGRWKVLATFNDVTGGGASRFVLAGNDDAMPGRRWLVAHCRRQVPQSPISEADVIRVGFFDTAEEARRMFMATVERYVPVGMTASA